jgi:hypothetical protein
VCGHARFDAGYEKEMMQPLDSVRVELCYDVDVSSRVFDMSLSRGSVQRVRREVRLIVVDESGVPVRLMTMRRMSTSVPDQCWRMTMARGVYQARII